MQKHRSLLTFLAILLYLSISACSKVETASPEARDVLYQVSTINSLMAGNYDGIKSIKEVSTKGDLGIGTFDTLDGEMVMIEGIVYKAKADGSVEKSDVNVTLPFTAVTYFDNDLSQEAGQIQNLDELKAFLDKLIVKKDRFYAFRIDGKFTTVQARSVPSQMKPYPILSEVTKNQSVFNYENVNGSMVGFWCPDTVGSINVPGYHLHFISDDRTKGGHLLNISFSDAKVMLDETRFFEMEIGEAASLGGLNDAQKEIDKVEK
jgi:acetolactate decarboxylase